MSTATYIVYIIGALFAVLGIVTGGLVVLIHAAYRIGAVVQRHRRRARRSG